MFSFFSKRSALPVGELLTADMHAHLIPGIDDGAPDLEISLKLIEGLMQAGYQKLIATPHIMSDLYPNTPEKIAAAFGPLKQELEKRSWKVSLEYAAEYLVDEHFESLVEEGKLLTFGNSYVLIETMFMASPPNLETIIFNMQTKGYRPVLAHPERYKYITEKFSRLERLRDMGSLLQVNLLSLAGYYGKTEKQTAQKMLAEGWVDFLGTDTHHERHLLNVQKFTVDRKTQKYLENTSFLNWALKA